MANIGRNNFGRSIQTSGKFYSSRDNTSDNDDYKREIIDGSEIPYFNYYLLDKKALAIKEFQNELERKVKLQKLYIDKEIELFHFGNKRRKSNRRKNKKSNKKSKRTKSRKNSFGYLSLPMYEIVYNTMRKV